MGGNVKTYILMTFDLENAPIDLKINRLRPWSIPYHALMSFHVDKQWATDTQTDRKTYRRNQTFYSCPLR